MIFFSIYSQYWDLSIINWGLSQCYFREQLNNKSTTQSSVDVGLMIILLMGQYVFPISTEVSKMSIAPMSFFEYLANIEIAYWPNNRSIIFATSVIYWLGNIVQKYMWRRFWWFLSDTLVPILLSVSNIVMEKRAPTITVIHKRPMSVVCYIIKSFPTRFGHRCLVCAMFYHKSSLLKYWPLKLCLCCVIS